MLITIIIIAIGLTFIALIATIVWLLKASGLFTPIRMKIAQPAIELRTVVYKFQKGDYSQSAEIFKDILNYSPSHSTMAIYYDNPETTPVEQRRYMVGVMVDEAKDQTIIDRMKTDDYQVFKLPKAVQSVYTTFPFNSVFSISIATMRVPSKLVEFIQTNKLNAHPFVEVYEPTLIHYFAPLDDHESYNVPEITSVSS